MRGVLTADGEFVLKNLVLISAALVLAGGGPPAAPSRSVAIPYPRAEAELSTNRSDGA